MFGGRDFYQLHSAVDSGELLCYGRDLINLRQLKMNCDLPVHLE